MGKRGPKPTPTKILEARGSWRAKTRKGEPRLDVAVCACPDWVTGLAREYWPQVSGALASAGVTTRLDAIELGLLVDALAEYIDARTDVARRGYMVRSLKGNTVPNPMLHVMHHAREFCLKMLRENGMTPSSRTGIQVPDKDGDVIDAAELFLAEKQSRGKS